MVVTGYGCFKNSKIVKLVIGKSIHYGVAFKKVGYRSLRRLVGLKMISRRLIGDMEEATLVVSSCFHMSEKCGDKGAEEFCVFGRGRVSFPTEYLFVFTVDCCHYLGRVICSPLSKEMRDLKIFDANAIAHIYPTVKQGKVEAVFAVFKGYID